MARDRTHGDAARRSTMMSAVASLRSQPRLAGYYVVMALVAVVFLALWLFEGYYLFTGWFPSLYDELTPINGVAAGAFMTLMLACALVSLARPTTAVGPTRVLLVGTALLGVLLPLAQLSSEPIVTVVGIAVTVTVVTLLIRLHPARSALRPSRPMTPHYALLGATLVLAVPFLWLAVEYQLLQFTREDAVAERWFYGGLTMYLLATLSFIALAGLEESARRFTAVSAVFLAAVLAAVSIVYPAELHSLGVGGGVALLGWCVATLAILYRA